MDVGHARKVFVDGFLSTRTGFQMELPLVPLGELYGSRLENWLRGHGVEVRLTTGVRAIDVRRGWHPAGVVLRTGELAGCRFRGPGRLVRSRPRTARRLPDQQDSRAARLELLQSSPITGIHLWFDRPVCPFDHVVMPGRLVQWVFNHTAIQGRTASRAPTPAGSEPGSSSQDGQYLQVVISASYDLLLLDKLAIRDAVLADLAEIWPVAREARLLRWWVVTEHGATFAVRPGVDRLRPPQRTPVDGLFLAGDWTDTGWPATMEGAVRSGYLAAQGILKDLDRPTRLIRPDLKREGWPAGCWAGLPLRPRYRFIPPCLVPTWPRPTCLTRLSAHPCPDPSKTPEPANHVLNAARVFFTQAARPQRPRDQNRYRDFAGISDCQDARWQLPTDATLHQVQGQASTQVVESSGA